MSETHRMRAWRQRHKDAGLVPIEIWISPETKSRYADLAVTHRRTLSELAQAALDAYRPGAPVTETVTGTVLDTDQLRALVQAELAPVTETVTVTVTETLRAQLQALIAAALAQHPSVTMPVTETVTETATETAAPVTVPVTETVTETTAPLPPHVQALAALRVQEPALSLAQLAQLAFDQNIYRAQGADGRPRPVNRGTLQRWLAQARVGPPADPGN